MSLHLGWIWRQTRGYFVEQKARKAHTLWQSPMGDKPGIRTNVPYTRGRRPVERR